MCCLIVYLTYMTVIMLMLLLNVSLDPYRWYACSYSLLLTFLFCLLFEPQTQDPYDRPWAPPLSKTVNISSGEKITKPAKGTPPLPLFIHFLWLFPDKFSWTDDTALVTLPGQMNFVSTPLLPGSPLACLCSPVVCAFLKTHRDQCVERCRRSIRCLS